MTEAEILAKMQARAEGLPFPVKLTSPEKCDLVNRELDGSMGDVRRSQQAIGRLNPRNPGIFNDLIQVGKRIMQRALSWYTRSLQEFGAALTSALQSHTIAIKNLAYSLECTGRSIEEVSWQTRGRLEQLAQRLERDVGMIASRARSTETILLRNQEDLLQLKARLGRELDAIWNETEAQTEALHEIRQEPDRLRSTRYPSAPDIDGDRWKRFYSLPFGVNVLGYLNSEKGVGEAGRSNLRIAEAAKIPHVANNTVDTGSQNLESLSLPISTANPYIVNWIAVYSDEFTRFAENNQSYFRGRYNIGYWAWEMPEFPAEWASAFNYVDEIWAPSQFARDAIATISPVPVRTIPHSIDPQLMSEQTAKRNQFGMPADSFVFLFLFDFHSFMERKNPLGLIAAYKNAFGSRTDVQLLIKSSHGTAGSNEMRVLQEASAGANIRILDEVLSRDDKHALMMAADCYVSLHRSEGFGLTLAEAMQCGKPVIATAYSGNIDFMTPETSFLVPYKIITLDQDHGPYKLGYHWAQPDLDYAADVMRHIAEHRDLAADVGLKAREHVWSVLHPATIARSVLGRLQELSLGQSAESLRIAIADPTMQ